MRTLVISIVVCAAALAAMAMPSDSREAAPTPKPASNVSPRSPKKLIKAHRHPNTSATVEAIAKEVQTIEKQAGQMRRVEIKDDGNLFDQLNTCCIDTTLYLQGGQLRKAVVRSWHGMDGFTMEWYFAGGKPIFGVETNAYQMFEKDVRLGKGKRPTYEVRLPATEPAEFKSDGKSVKVKKHAKGATQRMVLLKWQNRYYLHEGQVVRATTDYPGGGTAHMMWAGMVRELTKGILKSYAQGR